jgi:site-specific recombinase XerD
MKNTNFNNQFLVDFSAYLQERGVSDLTLKNYKSDINHFTGWLILKTRSLGILTEELSECIPFVSKKIGREYRNFLLENATPHVTINRRLSSLRHLARFLLITQIVDFDFMAEMPNIDFGTKKVNPFALINEFEQHLTKEKASKSTIKNYLSDIRHFLAWLETNNYSPKVNQ